MLLSGHIQLIITALSSSGKRDKRREGELNASTKESWFDEWWRNVLSDEG